jgi:hypothetical protein
MFQTEVEFTLPLGYVDAGGTLHRDGIMRRATAADEILPLRDHRVQANLAYLVVILLSRVITRLDGVEEITPRTIEGLYATDLAYLQDLYNRLNGPATSPVQCPNCQHQFVPDQAQEAGSNGLGGSLATPLTNSWEK